MQLGQISRCRECNSSFKPTGDYLCRACEAAQREQAAADVDELLVRAIKDVAKTAEDWPYIKWGELRTRRALVDPLLTALGWAPDNHSVVTEEYKLLNIKRFRPPKPDYALHEPGERRSPFAFIEAKRMRDPLTPDDRAQVIRYARSMSSVGHAFLTNGDVWEMYELMGMAQPRLVGSVSIRSQSPDDCARKLQWMFSRLPVAPPEPPRPVEILPEQSVPVLTFPSAMPFGWYGVGAIAAVVPSYVLGFWAARPVAEKPFFTAMGAILLGALVVLVGMWLWRLHVRRVFSIEWQWPRKREEQYRTATVTAAGAFVSFLFAGILGALTAQPVYDLLAAAGPLGLLLTLLLALIALLALYWRILRSAASRKGEGER